MRTLLPLCQAQPELPPAQATFSPHLSVMRMSTKKILGSIPGPGKHDIKDFKIDLIEKDAFI
jgi:hypothetical protein